MDAFEVVRSIFAFIIPPSLAMLGSICLGLALVLVLIDMPGGVNWSAVGGWCSFIGGFGALGAASGWLGVHIMSGQQRAQTFAQHYGGQLLGGGILVVVLLGAGLWAWKHLTSKGIDAGGKGSKMKKGRSLLKAGALALVGATVAIVVPAAFSGVNWVVTHLHGMVA